MFKKAAIAAVGLSLFLSPLIVSAQTLNVSAGCSTNPTVTCLQAEIQELVQILVQLLATHNQSTPPTGTATATIDQGSLTENTGTFSITGTATGSSINDGVTVFLAPGNYAYSTGYSTVFGQIAKDGFYQATESGIKDSGQWDAQFSSVNTGSYLVLVYDTATHALLTRGTLTVSNGGNIGQPSATITSPLTQTAGSFTMSGTAQNTSSVVVSVFTPDESGQFFGSGGIAVQNGTWTVTVPALSAGTYKVVVSDGQAVPAGSPIQVGGQLATATLTVNGASWTIGSLIASDPNSIASSIVAGATTGVTLGSFTLLPSVEGVNLQRVGLDLEAQQGSPSDITQAYVYQGSTLVGTVNFTGLATSSCPPAFTGIPSGGCYFATTTISSTLTQNTQANFTIKADIASIGTAQPGRSGDYIVIGLSDAQGVGQNSGATINSGSAPAQAGVRIFKSYPTVTQIPLKTQIGGINIGTPLLRYSVTANPSGPIGLLYQTFSSAVSGATLSNVQFSVFTDPAYSQPIAQSKVGVVGQTACTSGCSGASTYSFEPTTPVEVPAGTTYYFEVTGVVSPEQNATAYSVATTLLGDSSFDFPQTSVSDHFVWSPNDNGTSLQTTNDWSNGLNVAGLPIAGLSQTVTGTAAPQTTPAIALTTDASSVASGAYTTIRSSVSGVTSCLISGGIYGTGQTITLPSWTGWTGALTQATTYTVTCGAQTSSVTVSVTAPVASPLVTYTSISGGTVTGTYANIPATSTITVINQTSGQPVSGISLLAAGNGNISFANIPSGAFYLKAVSPSGAFLAQSVTFYSSGPSVPFACPVYQQQLCPAGESLQVGAVTYDANGCQVPHNSCVSSPPQNQISAPTCTYQGSTIAIEGGSDACRSWCLSLQAESPFGVGRVPVSSIGCIFQDSTGASQTVALSSTQNANLANALTALQSILQGLLPLLK